jgi:hypoxanthine phosphoribosyltransferase
MKLMVTQPLTVDIEDKKILVVDEICDSGKTFEIAVAHIKGLKPTPIKYSAL